MENIIEVKNLKYKYDQEDEKYTLNDVSFHVKQGEWLSIIGHNASGKLCYTFLAKLHAIRQLKHKRSSFFFANQCT